MNKEWVEQKNKENDEAYERQLKYVEEQLKTCGYFVTEEDCQKALRNLKDGEFFKLEFSLKFLPIKLMKLNKSNDVINAAMQWFDSLKLSCLESENNHRKYYKTGKYDRYLDSEPMAFDGDIIITDPCYIMNDKNNLDFSNSPSWWEFVSKATTEERSNGKGGTYTCYNMPKPEDYPDCRVKTKEDYGEDKFLYELEKTHNPPIMFSPTLKSEWDAYHKAEEAWRNITRSDWERCDYGSEMEVLGIHNYMTRDTLYGDWSCTTYDLNTKEPIGEFCADAGLVSVISLDEVLKYNPDFDYHLNRTWTTTLIKDFKGTVQFVVSEEEYIHSDDYIMRDGTVVWKKGDKDVEYNVEVVGHGVNRITGEPIDFVGKQTGL